MMSNTYQLYYIMPGLYIYFFCIGQNNFGLLQK